MAEYVYYKTYPLSSPGSPDAVQVTLVLGDGGVRRVSLRPVALSPGLRPQWQRPVADGERPAAGSSPAGDSSPAGLVAVAGETVRRDSVVGDVGRRARQALDRYFSGEVLSFDLPLAFDDGTGFQRSVWRALLDIPYGRTATYGDVAVAVDRPQAARAVGQAVGSNPLSIIVPCHRVIGSDGSLTGYGSGLALKRHLLRLEGALLA